MNAEEREQFRSAHADKSKDELFAAHNLRGTMVKAAREEQLVLHDLITEKEEIEQREASSGRVQKIGLDGGIDDATILSKFKSDPTLFERIRAKLEGK